MFDGRDLARRWRMQRAAGAVPAAIVLGLFAFDALPGVPQACITPTSRYIEVHAPAGAAVFIDGDRLTGARDSPTFPGEGPSHFPSLPLHESVQLRVEHGGQALEQVVTVSDEPHKIVWEVYLNEDDALVLEEWAVEDD